MTVLVDMNLAPDWETYLLSQGIKAIHGSKIGKAWASDEEIFAYAIENQCIIFTNDLDFGTILSKQKTKLPSIVQVRSLELSFEIIGSVVVKCLLSHHDLLEQGALVTIETDRLRIRSLPIR